ncbi:MAG: hypothetical protein ACJ73S_26005 [Mycobacteriales bacterium]
MSATSGAWGGSAGNVGVEISSDKLPIPDPLGSPTMDGDYGQAGDGCRVPGL